MTLGKRIKIARKEKKLSLEKLGDKLGVTRQLVWQWERDETDPRTHIEGLAAALGKPYDYFYGSASSDPLELKIRRLSSDHRAMIEASVDALLEREKPAKRAV